MRGDVIGLRVRQEVKNAWDNLGEQDKERIRSFLEEVVLLHATGFNMDLRRQEFDGLRAEVCPSLIKIVEYYNKSSCITRCYDPNVKHYASMLGYLTERLCKIHPVLPRSNEV